MSAHRLIGQAVVNQAVSAPSAPIGIEVGANGFRGDAEDAVNDHLIRSLCSALEAAEHGQDRYCVEALRLAIAVRSAKLRPDMRTAGPAGELTERQVRALQKWRLKRVIEYVDAHISRKIRLMDLAAIAGLSPMHFASQFRMATGQRPHEFLLRRRVRRAEELLRDSTMTIVEVALEVGFQTQAHFTTVFKRFVGCTPHHWRIASQSAAVPTHPSSARADVIVAP